ncbi:serine hydrolase [Streptomyces sp. WMMC500]|uniref:serine hydrolase domain-containing protein n=1 Tax=Streptomyces sp. WMMC500 TaxID=3015154 RepID=UPI00248BD7BE|nr:serine hydrolase domain-containing protein [Streptomyces sp. WMMC500]WBB61207.1 serine hydrolase [Streptomyces sp. WMMC500]
MTLRDEPLKAVAATAEPRAAVAIAVSVTGAYRTLCRGGIDRKGTASVTDRTRFEVGSVSKTFTALLLADTAARGELGLTDRIAERLPYAALPRGHGRAITYEHLATHTSGLPRLPPGLMLNGLTSWFANPYRSFTPDMLLPALARAVVHHPPGTLVRYSNLGVGLLGRLLADGAGTDYGSVLHARVLAPLELADTGTASPDHPGDPSYAVGYWHGRRRPPWAIPALPGAGAVRSSARDLVRYLRAHLDPEDSDVPGSLRTPLAEVVRIRDLPAGEEGKSGLAWSVRTLAGATLYFHSGATRGCTSFVGLSPEREICVAALTNSGVTLRSRFIQSAYLLLRSLALGEAK